ncbi:MAG TPA: signal peptidase I [Lachnospiraceae bacterium]|nr:signal peptidase I [Lachnospiraceae bacterium]
MARGRSTGARDRSEYRTHRKKHAGRGLIRLFLVIFVLALVVVVFSSLLCSAVKVESGAMNPSISISDTVGINHLAYLLLRPRRGDIVQFKTPEAGRQGTASVDTAPIRRIIGLPGETVQISDGTVYINGAPLQEEYRSGEMTYGGIAVSALTLNSDEYFLMADNRSNNFDSRDSTVGPVTETAIVGKVWLRLNPLERFGLIG